MEKMTIFYSKSNSSLKSIIIGEQDFKLFGADEEDYKLIYEKLIIEKDDYVLKNPDLFIVKDGELKLRPQEGTSKYQVADQ